MLTWKGVVFRTHTPRYAWNPLSTDGCLFANGRFNKIGDRVLYLSLDPNTSYLEVSNGINGLTDPKTIVAYEVSVSGIADLRTPSSMATLRVSEPEISLDNWRDIAESGGNPPSWDVVQRMKMLGANGLMCPSYAEDVADNAINLILWKYGTGTSCSISIYDPLRNLPKDDSSWPLSE